MSESRPEGTTGIPLPAGVRPASMPLRHSAHRARPVRYWLQLAVTLAVCLFLVVPIGMSILAGVTQNYFVGIASGVTLRWVGQVWALYHDTVWRSIGIALACLACTLLLGVPAAYALARGQGRITRWIEELLVLPVAVPGLATALGLILLYGTWRDFRASWLFILVGHVLFTLPFMVRSVLAVMLAVDLEALEEAAASLGARFGRRFVSVVLPNVQPGILAGSLMVLTLSMGEFNLTWMLHTPLTKTLPVGLADSYASMRLEVGSAYTLVFLFMIVPLLVALQRMAARTTAQRPY
jgi:putative spermidine/putrescine transport system permease protein